MLIGITDNSEVNTAFAVEALMLITADGPEHCIIHLGSQGVSARVHLTPSEFMTRIGSALEQVQGRAALLGLAHGNMPKQ